MPYLLYFGHVNVDVIMHVKEFAPIGESREVGMYESRIGGTAYNAYKSLKNLGVPVKIFSVISPEMEDEVEGYFVFDDRNPTCWVVTDGREQMAYVYQGKWNRREELSLDYEVLQDFDWIHISTGNPDFYLDIARYAKKMGKNIGFDPSQEIHYVYGEERFIRLLELSDLFFCNEREYKRALELAGDLLFEKTIVRTEGAKGASLYIPEKGWLREEAFKVPVIDTTGAGDSFRAGFYAALYHGHSLQDALRIGNFVASKVVSNEASYYLGGGKMFW